MIETMARRVLILDGAMGTMIQRAGLDEGDFHLPGIGGERVMKGCNDILVLSRPDVIEDIHRRYIDAGADIIETCTFNANRLSLSEYGLEGSVDVINREAVGVARRAADSVARDIWVAGSVGPTGKSLTMAVNLGDDIDFDTMESAYYEQVYALIGAGVDMLLIETIFDTLNAKAAIHASLRAMETIGREVPFMLSATLTESGRTLSGQTLEAFVASVAHARPLVISLNCGFGPEALVPYVESLKDIPAAVGMYANAGLPNKMGGYDETPEQMAAAVEPLLKGGYLNIVGGCCGTTPAHIVALSEMAARLGVPREIPVNEDVTTLAGLEPLVIEPGKNLINIGERCNVAGSRKFLRLIKESKYEEAVEIARSQVEGGAQAVDVNMDDGMLDAVSCMSQFMRLLQVEPAVARVPMVIDSSRWEVILAGLKCVQGKPLVNSISLKEGEKLMLSRAREIHRLGAAMVVMAFDEEGQATTYERKVEICTRAYKLLTEKAGIPPCDIFFDPNILTVATGIREHDAYALDYIRAVREIKRSLPGAKTGGGVSNLSFAFRGNTPLREAMHAVFLYHAVAAGLDTAIVNAAALIPVDDVAPELREAIEDVLFMRREDASERLAAIATDMLENADKATHAVSTERESVDPAARLADMVVRGVTAGLEETLAELAPRYEHVVDLIDGVLMQAMNRVGELFGSGRMFLPQVVKSATVMKNAVALLQPRIEAEQQAGALATSRRTIVLATVKGDVHDIGKNIVAIIMKCNGWNVVDLGVMVPAERIIEAIREHQADAVGLSGLITPSLEEMAHVARLLESEGIDIPLFVGGATTSALHTAVKIAPERSSGGVVVHTRDAAMLPGVAARIVSPETCLQATREVKREQARIREANEAKDVKLLSLQEARLRRYDCPTPSWQPREGVVEMEYRPSELRPLVNVKALLAAWKLDVANPDAPEAIDLVKSMDNLLARLEIDGYRVRGRVVTLPAHADENDDIVVDRYVVPMLRQQSMGPDGRTLSVADYVGRGGDSNISLFAVTAPTIVVGDDNEYDSLLAQSVAHRLVEAAAEAVHCKMGGGERVGIRPAIGYPMIPDQGIVHLLDPILRYGELGVEVTEHGALYPSATVTGFIIYAPEARYFEVGKIGQDQFEDYARRRGLSVADLKPYLIRN